MLCLQALSVLEKVENDEGRSTRPEVIARRDLAICLSESDAPRGCKSKGHNKEAKGPLIIPGYMQIRYLKSKFINNLTPLYTRHHVTPLCLFLGAKHRYVM